MKIGSAAPLALVFVFGATAAASAHVRHHHEYRHLSRHHYAQRIHRRYHLAKRTEPHSDGDGHGLVHVQTAAGQITVASNVAGKFKDLIAALVAKGFKGDVHCYASSGHVAHSLHYSGHACDFAQDGRNKTVSIMYHSGDLIRSFGLRDGCSFRDCGHVDAGLTVASRHRARHFAVYAARRHEHAHYRLAAHERHEPGDDYAGLMMYGGSTYGAGAYGGGERRGRYRAASLTYQRDRLTPQ